MTDRELDLLVAQHVMEWTDVRAVSYGFICNDGLPPGKKRKNDREPVPDYSTTGDGMLSVIEKLAGKFQIRIDGCNVSAHESGLPRGCWGVTIAPWGTDPDDGRGSASPNLPRAVAIAALRALVPGFET